MMGPSTAKQDAGAEERHGEPCHAQSAGLLELAGDGPYQDQQRDGERAKVQ